MSVDTVTVQNTGNALGELAFPNKETFKSKNNIASVDSNGKLLLAQAPYVAGTGIRISNSGVISATGGGSGGGSDEHNKGWYATPDQLPSTGENGDYAIVGSTDTVWVWDGDTSSWVDSGAKEVEDINNRINQLFQTKLDKGVLYCNGGYAKVPQGAFISLSKATMLVRFARSNTTRTAEEYICNIGDGGSENTGISLRLLPDNRLSVLLRFKKADGTLHNGAIPAFDALPYLDKKIHSVAVCWAGTSAKIYIDGVFKGSASNIPSDATIVQSYTGITLAGRGATNAQFFYGQVSDFAVLNYDASEVDSNGNYTSDYSIADYQNGRAIPPWTVPIVFGNGKSASANTVNASCVWSGADWSMTQTSNAATVKSMLYYIPLSVGQKLRIRFSNLTGGVLVNGKYGFFQPVGQEADKIDVSTTSLNAEFTATTTITLWRFQFNCEAVDDAADRVPTVFENFVVERDGAVVALENYTFKNKIRDTSGNGNDANINGLITGDTDNSLPTASYVSFEPTAGITADTVQAAITNVNLLVSENNTAIGALNNQVHFIDASIPDHTTTISGILDVVNNDSVADIRINGQSLNTKYATQTALDLKQDKNDDTLKTTDKTIVGAINEINTATASKASQVDLTTLQNKVTNISTSDGKTIVTGTLEVVGSSDTDIPTVDTGENGQVLTNTIVVSDEIDTAKIAMSGNKAVKIESFDTSISASSTDTGLPTSKAVYTAINGISTSVTNKANLNASNLSDANVTSWKEKLEIDVIEADLDTKVAKSDIATSISDSPVDTKVASEKAVSDAIDGLQTKVTSTVEVNVAPTTAKTATAITGALAKSARVVVVPKYTNIGAVYVKETTTYSAVNPIYPDPVNNVYEFNNMQNVKVFVDSLGDNVDLIIEYRG